MFRIDSMPKEIDIGYTGEKNFRSVQIDMSAWSIENGVPAVVYVRPNETAPYKPTVTYSDGVMTWTVTDTDLGSAEGKGKMQIEMKSSSVAAKSEIIQVNVHNAIMR